VCVCVCVCVYVCTHHSPSSSMLLARVIPIADGIINEDLCVYVFVCVCVRSKFMGGRPVRVITIQTVLEVMRESRDSENVGRHREQSRLKFWRHAYSVTRIHEFGSRSRKGITTAGHPRSMSDATHPSSGVMPRSEKGYMNLASVDASTRSCVCVSVCVCVCVYVCFRN
jgi:hypothetical protein